MVVGAEATSCKSTTCCGFPLLSISARTVITCEEEFHSVTVSVMLIPSLVVEICLRGGY